MSKVVPIAIASAITAGTAALVYGVRIERTDGEVLGWTQHDRKATVPMVGGEQLELLPNPGFDVSSFVCTAGLAVDNATCNVIAGDDITRADIYARRWDGAQVKVFRYDANNPAGGIVDYKAGSLGNFEPELGQFKVEFRDIRQGLQTNSTWLFQEGCRNRLGDKRCKVDLEPWTHEGEVTAVASQYEFTVAAFDQAEDYYGEGDALWLSGANAGCWHKVRTSAEGVLTLVEPAVFTIEAGDQLRAIAGCRLRKDEDCRDKFGNVLNFNGEADVPKKDELLKPGELAEV